MRSDLDRGEAGAGVGLDHPADARLEVDPAAQVGRNMPDRLQAYADDHRAIFALIEKTVVFVHDYLRLSASPAAVHKPSACSLGLAIASTAAAAFSASSKIIRILSRLKASARPVRWPALSGGGPSAPAPPSFRHSTSSSIRPRSSKL